MPRPRRVLLLPVLAAFAAPAGAGDPAGHPERNCFWQLAHGRGSELACEHRAWLSDQERDDLRKLTRELLQDARCTIAIRIPRVQVDDALELTEHTFQSPPQPVSCDITTKESSFTVTGTFAPRVVIKDGKAVEATPGLADVKGVNSYLAWPVIQYVNRAPGIRGEMLAMINLYLERLRTRRTAGGR